MISSRESAGSAGHSEGRLASASHSGRKIFRGGLESWSGIFASADGPGPVVSSLSILSSMYRIVRGREAGWGPRVDMLHFITPSWR